VRISARADYALRALLELAAAEPDRSVHGDVIATAQGIPFRYLENILAELRRARLVESHRGAAGGYRLAKTPRDITLADVIRAIDGPLAGVRGAPPEAVEYPGPAAGLREVWVALRASMRLVLEKVTLADIVEGRLPASVRRHLRDPDAWVRR
jgi:Rrf2 family protein